MEYLQRLSLWLDIRILLLSVWNTLIARWDHRSGKAKLDGRSDESPDTDNQSQNQITTASSSEDDQK